MGKRPLSFSRQSIGIPLPVRMRAARDALQFEHPKLAVVAQLSEQNIGALLEQRLRHVRSHYPEAKLIEHQPEQLD